MINENQIGIIRSLKNIEQKYIEKLIPIKNNSRKIIGYLKPIDRELSNDKNVILSLVRWRQMFSHCFLTQFKTTEERTMNWLNNIIIKDDTRILFLILDETNRAIGNFGIFNISNDSAELDNLIRGESGGSPKLIFFSEVALICWIYNVLRIDNIYLHVFSNNLRTIALHESVGFIQSDTYRLIKEENNGEIKYIIDYSNKPNDNEFGYTKMTLDKNNFFSRHYWLEE